MAELPTGTVTFLFTDIEGSTHLLQLLGQATYARCLEDHNEIMRDAIAAVGGIEIRTEGDAVFAVFTTAPAALEAVVAAQRALHHHAWPEGAPFRVRMGLHTGAGILGADDYVGIDVHRAARIADAGFGGQVLLSAAAAAIVAPEAGDGVVLTDLGEHRLKDLADAEHLYQAVIAGLPSEFPALRSLDAVANNLPVQLTSFVGREAELAATADLLARHRLLTFTGPGGTGKTRLALQLAAEVMDRFDDGVFFVALSRLSDPDLVPTSVLGALGLYTTAAGVDPVDHLHAYLSRRTVLLVLDNFEQLAGGAPFVGELLRAAPEVKIVVTSRVPLHVSGEREVPVPPLSVSDPDIVGTPGDAAGSESIALFTERAAAIRPDFELDESNVSAVARLTARLDGLPLAIELAASRIKLLTPAAILERLDNRLLANPAVDLPERQRTMINAIGWSYDLLDEPARRLFEVCSVFVGGAALPQIESVAGDGVLDELTVLVDQSLMRQSARVGEPRFGMLIVIREFASAALTARGADREFRARHAAAYLDLAEEAAPHLLTSRRGIWLDRLAIDHENLSAALGWAIDHSETVMALRFVADLWRYWQIRGHLYRATEMIDAVLALSGDVPDLRAAAFEAAGGVAYWRGDFPGMVGPYEEAVSILRGQGEPAGLALALYNLSFARVGEGDYEGAEALLAESLAISEGLGDHHGIGRAHWGRFNVAWYQDYRDDMVEHARRAAVEFETLDAPYDLGWAYFAIGSSLLRGGEVAPARENLQRALPLFVDAGDQSAIVVFLNYLGALAGIEGEVDRAARLAGAAHALKEKTGVALIDAMDTASSEVDGVLIEAEESAPAAYEEGRSMSVEEAVADALG